MLSTTGTGNNTSQGQAVTPKPKEEHLGKLSDEKFEQYKKEGRCFNYSKQGHRKPDCPKPKLSPQISTLEPKENNGSQSDSNKRKDQA
jgi:hypothetical protein